MNNSAAADDDGVNQHFLDHVVSTAASHQVEASEDIVAGNGMKLLAKGTRIAAEVRERLLQHKLRKPLEECVQVADGVTGAQLEPIAQQLLDRLGILQRLCAGDRGRPAPASIASLTLSLPVQSMLTIYSRQPDERLRHCVGVAMFALTLARRLLPDDIARHRAISLAGLLHDIGELYIDPAILGHGTRLDPERWRHVVAHPLVGHRVLKDMPGAGTAVADLVLDHHERLDGFGYPRGQGGQALPLGAQILAAAEWLMGLSDTRRSPLLRARMATSLVPGEFSADLIETINSAAQASEDELPPPEMDLASAAPRIMRLADTLRRFRDSRAWLDGQIETAPPALRQVLSAGLNRMLRIQASFSSTGLDAADPDSLLKEMAGLDSPAVHAEIITMVAEMEWRMRQLERHSFLHASSLDDKSRAVVEQLVERLRGARD